MLEGQQTEGRALVLSETAGVCVSELPPCGRYSLRLLPEGVAAAADALGIEIPLEIGKRSAKGPLDVLCLGPDEWMILCDDAAKAGIEAGSAALSATQPHSLVDLSDREIMVEIAGEQAQELLTLGMARDPDTILVGEGRRTVFDGVAAVILRDGETRWRLAAWRSMMPHVVSLLVTGSRELQAG